MKTLIITIALVALFAPLVVVSKENYPEFTDISISLSSWLDLMPKIIEPGEDENAIDKAYFVFHLGIKSEEFREKYEVKSISINDEDIDLDKEFYYQEYSNSFRVDTIHYQRGINKVKIIILNKETNQKYIKQISQELDYAY